MRSWKLVGLAVALCLVAGGLLLERRAPDPPAAPSVAPSPGAVEQPRALTVLRQWDADRAAAWRAGDDAALAALYLAGSAAGRRDVRLLRRWERTGWRVERLDTQLLAVDVRHSGPRRLVLRVRDRVAGGLMLREEPRPRQARLPDTPTVTRDVTLVLGPGGWQVARVVPR